jgi:hypothetical protein
MAGNKEFFAKAMIWFGFFMVAVFLGLGLMVIFLPVFSQQIPDPSIRKIFGFFFLAYGVFRLARITTQIRELKRKERNEQ